MEAYSSSYTSKSLQSHSSLHSVRKSQGKPWKKVPVAPPPPTPVRVYEVDVLNFRDVVQQLTGAPEFQPQLHHQLVQSVATPSNPLFSSRDNAAVSNNWYQEAQFETLGVKSQAERKSPGLLELNLSSPSSYNWCSSLP